MTTPPEPGDREQQAPFPAAPPSQPYQQNPYPPPLGADEIVPPGGTRPKDVDTSFRFWMGAIVLNALFLLGALLVGDGVLDEVRWQLRQTSNQYTPQQLDSLVAIAGIGIGVGSVVTYGLWLMFVLFMRKGKNWARIVLTVISGLWLLFILLGLASTGGIGLLIALAQIALVGSAVFFMFRPATKAYFGQGILPHTG